MNFKQWLLKEEAAPDKQAHVFDFDDTIAVTDSPNIVMLFQDGKPSHISEQDVIQWLKQNGINKNELLIGPHGKSIEWISNKQGFASYVSSSGLAKIQNNYPGKESITGLSDPLSSGPSILIDFTSSFGVDHNSARPIKQTIDKIKKLNAAGADTMVLTARRGEGRGKSIHGHEVEPTNAKDIMSFLNKQGASPTSGVVGTAGGDKGHILYNKAVGQKPDNKKPEEIHFYDDSPKNTRNVQQTLGGKIKQDLNIYGPGDFATGHASVDRPNVFIPGKKYKEAVLAYDIHKTGEDPEWMMDKKDTLRQMYQDTPKKAMHQLKSWWNQAVDRNFIQSVTTIHYGSAKILDKEIQSRVQELSCIGYLKPPYKNLWVGNCGLVIKGYVTLAGNSDLQTNQWMGSSSRGERRKWSEYYRDFIINKETFTDPDKHHNEFLVSNWKPVAIIRSISTYGSQDEQEMPAKELAEKYNLPLIDENGHRINSQTI